MSARTRCSQCAVPCERLARARRMATVGLTGALVAVRRWSMPASDYRRRLLRGGKRAASTCNPRVRCAAPRRTHTAPRAHEPSPCWRMSLEGGVECVGRCAHVRRAAGRPVAGWRSGSLAAKLNFLRPHAGLLRRRLPCAPECNESLCSWLPHESCVLQCWVEWLDITQLPWAALG